jgi:hypothetical protein
VAIGSNEIANGGGGRQATRLWGGVVFQEQREESWLLNLQQYMKKRVRTAVPKEDVLQSM